MIDAFHNNRRVETRGGWEKTSGRWFLSGISSLLEIRNERVVLA
jgi:hypothetical protein